MKKRLTIQQLQVATGGDPLNELKALTLAISGVVRNSDEARNQFASFLDKLSELIASSFPDFAPDSPGATLDIDDLEIEY